MSRFPEIEIPDIYRLSKKSNWNPKLYSPLIFDEKIKKYSEILKPGTLSYDDFWDEMDYYCFNGFQPKGMPRITGRHFYYLNMTRIMVLPKNKKTKILSSPFYRDLDHWLFLEYEGAEKYGYGLIVAKPRQVGLSEFGVLHANYNMRFYKHSEVSVAAGKDDKVQEFKQKLEQSLANTHPAYRCKVEVNNDKLMEMFFYDTINKEKIKGGPQTKSRFKTMFADSGAFEGINNCKLAIFEEMGLFENAPMSFKATAPSFRSGAIQFGVPLCYGTGGEIDKGAKGYKEMWDNNEAYNLKRIFVPAYYFFPGDGIEDKETKKTLSFFDYEKGVTDREAAKKYIIEDRKIAAKSKDSYVKHVQTYPLTAAEVFLKTKGGILDLPKLNFQLKEINEGNSPEPVMRGRLEWDDTPEVSRLLQRAKTLKEKTKIRVANEVKVKFVLDDDGPVWKQGNPLNQNISHLSYKPDIGGCDSYDEEVDESNEAVSSGCVMAYRCFSGPSREFNYPVGVLVERGDASFDDDVFYENAVKFAIYWDIEVLFEYTKFHILRYFYDVGAYNHIKGKPNLEGGATEAHKNKDGVKMTNVIKPILIKMLKSEVRENIHKCFIENIILDLIKFGDGNTDIAMTYGICLLHRMDIFDEITEGIENGNPNYDMELSVSRGGSYYIDTSGNLRINLYGGEDVEYFIPERDLTEKEYERYIADKDSKNKEILQKQSEYEKKAQELGVDASILSIIFKEQESWNTRN